MTNFGTVALPVGPEVCDLAKEGNATAAQRRFWSWVNSLDESPYSYLDESGKINILTGDDVRRFATDALYTQVQSFKTFQCVIYKTMNGDKSALATIFTQSGSKLSIQDSCKMAGNTTDSNPPAGKAEVEAAILCGDGDDVTGKSAAAEGTVSVRTDTSPMLLTRVLVMLTLV